MVWLAYLQPICSVICALPKFQDSQNISSVFRGFYPVCVESCAINGGGIYPSSWRMYWDIKRDKMGFGLLLITINDSGVAAKYSLWDVIMAFPA